MNLILSENQYELLKLNLKDSRLINEATNWNTLADVLGIFDPSGIVDFLNGISYLKQGDTFFGILSMISALPLFGDALAKPLLIFGKSGGIIRKADAGLKLARSGRVAEATDLIRKMGQENKIFGKLSQSVGDWGKVLIEKLRNLPSGILSSGLRGLIIDWIKLFQNVNKGSRVAGKLAKKTTDRLAKQGAKLSQSEAENLLKRLKTLAQQDSRTFRGMGGKPVGGVLTGTKYLDWSYKAWKNSFFTGGVPRLWGNRVVRSLMTRTKWWFGFLDYIGFGNFVGPEELKQQIGDYNNQLNQYSQTKQAEENWNDDFGQNKDNTQQSQESQPTQNTQQNSKNILDDLLFGGIPGIKPGIPGV